MRVAMSWLRGSGGGQRMKSQFLSHSLKTYATQMVLTVLQGLVAIFSARLLGPANKGVYSLLAVILMMVVIVGRCGLGNAVIYFCGRKQPATVLFNGFLLIGMIGAASVLLSLPLVFFLRHSLLQNIPLAGLIWMAMMIPVLFFSDYLQSAFIAVMQMNRRNLLVLMQPLIQLILLVVTVGILRRGLAGALFSLSLAMVVGVGWSITRLKPLAAIQRLRADKELMKHLLRFGIKSHVGGVMEVMNTRADFFIINYFLGPAAVGFFSVAANLAEIVWRFPEAVVMMLMPKVSRMDAGQARAFTPRICRMVLLPVLAICLGLLLLGRFLILFFFGVTFLPAVQPFYFLLPGFVAFAVWKILAGDLVAQGHPLIYSTSSALAFLSMVLLDLWLIPVWGIAGAAAAASIALFFAALVIVVMYRRVTGTRLAALLIPQKNDFRLLRETFQRGGEPDRKG